jgi:hypothetical protein
MKLFIFVQNHMFLPHSHCGKVWILLAFIARIIMHYPLVDWLQPYMIMPDVTFIGNPYNKTPNIYICVFGPGGTVVLIIFSFNVVV